REDVTPMIVRMPLTGAGTAADPYRIALPTYWIVDEDAGRGVAIVAVPDEDVPAELRSELEQRPPGPRRAARPLPAPARARWREHLDRGYQEHAGEYDPDAD